MAWRDLVTGQWRFGSSDPYVLAIGCRTPAEETRALEATMAYEQRGLDAARRCRRRLGAALHERLVAEATKKLADLRARLAAVRGYYERD